MHQAPGALAKAGVRGGVERDLTSRVDFRHCVPPDRNRLPPALLPRRHPGELAVTGPWPKPPAPASPEDPIEHLVAQIQSGIDVEGNFGRLYKLFHPKVFRILLGRGLRPSVCEELTQEAFISVFNEIGTLQNQSAFTPWLFKIVKNLYNNEMRRQGALKRDAREVPLEEEMGPDAEERRNAAPALVDGAPNAEQEIVGRERSASLRDAVATLPPQMRRCVFLRVYQDLKYREIAEVLGINIDTVKAHLGQAKTRLQRLLREGDLTRLTAGEPGSEDER
jgi:RNA polymerase sigma-70 factor, ECF subfamily